MHFECCDVINLVVLNCHFCLPIIIKIHFYNWWKHVIWQPFKVFCLYFNCHYFRDVDVLCRFFHRLVWREVGQVMAALFSLLANWRVALVLFVLGIVLGFVEAPSFPVAQHRNSCFVRWELRVVWRKRDRYSVWMNESFKFTMYIISI